MDKLKIKADFTKYIEVFLQKNAKLNLISKNDEKLLFEKNRLRGGEAPRPLRGAGRSYAAGAAGLGKPALPFYSFLYRPSFARRAAPISS